MFWLRNKKIIFSYALLSGGLDMTIAVNWDVQHQTKPKTVWTQIRTVSGFKPFDTLIVFLKEFKKKKKKKNCSRQQKA